MTDFDLSKITGHEPPLEVDPHNRISELEAEIERLRETLEEIKPILKEARFSHCYSVVEKALAPKRKGPVRFLACGEEYTVTEGNDA